MPSDQSAPTHDKKTQITLIGADGRLGGVLLGELVTGGYQVTGLTLSDLDITDAERVAVTLERLRPDVIVNCSAYNAVDAAEDHPSAAFAVNATGPSVLADAADATGALLVHFSTDFVFDGRAREPYREDASPNPLGVYGQSKLAGEEAVRKSRRHYICRLESLFGGSGFQGHQATIDQIADRILDSRVVRAIADRTVSPSYAVDVAVATRRLIEIGAPYGVYHCVNSGYTTWIDLAHEVARELGVLPQIEPILSADLHAVAPRPLFCALSNDKLLGVGIQIPTWQSAVRRHLAPRSAAARRGARESPPR